MASRLYKPAAKTLVAGCVTIHGKFAIATDSESSSLKAPGVSSIGDTATGRWTINLADTYANLVSAQLTWLCAGANDVQFIVRSEDVDSAATPVVVVSARKLVTDWAESHPGVAGTLMFSLCLSNSSRGITR